LIGGGASVIVAALAYRAWDHGVFTGATGPAYAAWDEWRGSETDGRPLRAGILAASPHNTALAVRCVRPHDRGLCRSRPSSRHLRSLPP
jgi:hypothetical protein